MQLENANLSQILNFQELKELFKQFALSTGLDVSLFDRNGDVQLGYRHPNSVCSLTPEHVACKEFIKYGGEKSMELGEPYIYSSACGLILCSLAIIINDELVGSIACGPVMLWEKDEFAIKEFLQRIKPYNDINEDEAKDYLDNIKCLDCINMTACANLLGVLIKHFIKDAERHMEHMLEISKLNLEKRYVQAAKEEADGKNFYNAYPVKLEKELIAYVHLGEKQKAKEIINKFLSEIFSYASGNLDIIKVKLYEFFAFLSRSAVTAGATLENLKSSIQKSANLLITQCDFNDICFATIEIIDNVIDVVYKSRNKKSTSQHLARAIEYIHQHFKEDLSLETLAKNVFVSQYYLSHLFREEMNVTFVDYLSTVRIDEAKKLLNTTNLSVEKITELTGFKDANYFIKAFKKITGLTPAKYRNFVVRKK